VKKFRFLPSEENFFELFDEIAQILVESAICLHELTLDYSKIDEKAQLLREKERQVDRTTDGIIKRLKSSFVTPIDPEDIHALASHMDDVLDYIEASADRMKLYGVEEPREEAALLAGLIVEGTKHIQVAVAALSHFRDIDAVLRPCIEINHVENQADVLEKQALARLFKEESKPLEVAKWMEIFNRLESATDRCEDVANVIESIVVKNA
jgi:hypothetical protein